MLVFYMLYINSLKNQDLLPGKPFFKCSFYSWMSSIRDLLISLIFFLTNGMKAKI